MTSSVLGLETCNCQGVQDKENNPCWTPGAFVADGGDNTRLLSDGIPVTKGAAGKEIIVVTAVTVVTALNSLLVKKLVRDLHKLTS